MGERRPIGRARSVACAVLLSAAALLLGATASAAERGATIADHLEGAEDCHVEDAVLTVEPSEDAIMIRRAGKRVIVRAASSYFPWGDARTLSCDGPQATLTNIDEVVVGASPYTILNLREGLLEPGLSAEEGSSSEIEVTIAQGDDGHELLLGGGRQQVRLGDLGEGHAGINLNAQEKVSDVDVRLNLEPDIDSGGPYILVRAGGGSDKVDAGGGREFTGPWGRFFDTPYDDSFLAIFGGDGRDVLRGGQGMDYIFGGPQPDTIFTARGPDYVIAQGGGRDEIDCGLGPDRAFVDRLDETSRCRRRENKLRSASSAITASDAGHAPTGRFGVARRLSSTLGRG